MIQPQIQILTRLFNQGRFFQAALVVKVCLKEVSVPPDSGFHHLPGIQKILEPVYGPLKLGVLVRN